MAFDQNITYRVNVDDTNFQSRLTQMRASIDATMGGGAGGGFSAPMMYGMMNTMGGGGWGGGTSDFGTQIRPVSYTPPAIAMQPHFGMFQIQQTLGQAGLGAMGPAGAAMSGGVGNLLRGTGGVPNNVTMSEYMGLSSRAFADRAGDAVSIGALTVASTAAGLAAGGAGTALGSAMFGGAGVGAFLGGTVMGMGAGALVSAYTGQVTDMMADNRQIQSSLAAGSFRFATGGNVDPMTGRGFRRSDRFNIAKSIQGMEMNDQRFGMDEYKQILEGGMQMDLFRGTGDADDFKTKFKGLVDTVKTVASTLHTSLKEGLEVMRGFRDMGVTDPGQITRMTLGSEVMGRMSGKTGMEMMAIGQTGAEMFRGTGIDMSKGFELNQMNAVGIRSMLNNKLLSEGTVGQAGGEMGLAQQMTASALQSFQTSQGRAMLMANYNPATNSLNPNMMSRGGDLMSQISGAAGMGPAALMKFQANQEDIISKMSPQQMQLFGIKGAMGGAQMLMQSTGADFETSFRVWEQNQGKNKMVIDTEMAMLHQDPDKMKQEQAVAIETMRTQAGMEDFRNRFSIGKRISNTLRRTFVAPVANALGSLSASIGESVENATLALEGAQTINPNVMNKNLVARGQAVLSGMSNDEKGEAIDISGSAYQRLVGGQTGQKLIDEIAAGGDRSGGDIAYRGVTAHVFSSMADAKAAAKASGETLHVGKDRDGNYIGISTESISKLTNAARGRQATEQDAKDVANAKIDPGVGDKLAALGKDAGLAAFMKTATGVSNDDMDKLSDEAFQKKYKHSKGYFTALTDKAFATYGANHPKVKEEMDRAVDSSSGSDALRVGQSWSSQQADEANTSLRKTVSSDMGLFGERTVTNASGERQEATSILKDNLEATSILFDDKLTSTQKKARLAEVTKGFDFSDVIKKVEANTTAEQREKAKSLAAYAAKTKAEGEATGGGAGTGKVGGDISSDTQKVIEGQSAQLVSNYKALIALQEQLNKLQGGKH